MISVNNPISFYGNPDVFWTKLNESPMIHVLDEYVNSTADNRYPVGDVIEIDGIVTANLDEPALLNAAYQKLVAKGDGDASTLTGTAALYDLIVPPDSTPNDGCSYHTTGNISAGGKSYPVAFTHIQLTCRDNGDHPNSPLVDTAASTVLHENFESISDPFLNGWGGEIGDVCPPPPGDYSFHNYTMSDGSVYAIQPTALPPPILCYSRHAC